tara:strand:+ start:806 stop:1153 length:348 start_codon:yes stop_codon:yes gene_type:complete
MKIFFNNSCKICRTEINLYKKENVEDLNWIDITNNVSAKKEINKTDRQLLRRLHVKFDNKVYVGVDAFLLIWKKIPKYKFLYNIFKLPVFYQIFYILYEIAAVLLFIKNRKQLKN